MAEGEDPYVYKAHDPYVYDDDDPNAVAHPYDYKADETAPFVPNGASTPYQAHGQEEIQMKSFQEQSGRPGPSYAETSFGGTEDLERRLANLRRNHITQMLDTTEKIPTVENPLSLEEKQIEIQRVRDFIKKRFPNADLSKLVISFSSSSKKPMDIVIKGPKGGETKIIKDNGSDFQKSFLNLTYVKTAVGESFEVLRQKENEKILKEKKKLSDKAPTDKDFESVDERKKNS